MEKEEIFTDLLAAVAESLKNSTSHLSRAAGVSQSGAAKIMHRNTGGTATLPRCTNITKKTASLVSPTAHTGSQNASRRSSYKETRYSSKLRPISVNGEINQQNEPYHKFSVDERHNYKHSQTCDNNRNWAIT